MKKINYFPVLSLLAGVLAATLFFSCSKNEVTDPGDSIQNPIVDTEPDGEGSEPEIPETPDDPTLIPQEGEMTEDGRPVVMLFGARIGDDEEEPEADSESTKTHLGTPSDGKYPNYWSVGDQVKINNTPSATLPSENIYEGGKQARFPMAEVVSKYNGNWYVGYPASAFSFSSGTGTVTVPSVQTYASGSYDPSAYILLGKSASQSVRFYPKMAVVRFTPQDADPTYGSNIKSVRIEAIGNDAMSGQFTTDYNNESASFAPVDGQSYPYVQINAPNQASGLAFGTQFFFLIPAKTYSEGIRFVITTVDGKSMSVSKTGAYTASVSTTSTIKPPKYVPSTVTLSSPLQLTSSAILTWTGGNSANDFKKAWRLAVYSNSACNSLVVSHDIPADPNKENHWENVDGSTVMEQPRFAVTGLNPGTHYWCKVTDIANNVSSAPLEITTEAFTRVTAASPSGSTLLAEDFGEIAVGPIWGNCAAGWMPANASTTDNSLSLAAPTGVVSTGYYQKAKYSTNNLSSNFDFSTAPRFNAGWGFLKDGSLTVYPQAGYLRVGGKDSNRTMVVLPQLSGITTDKYATVDVTIKAAHCVSADVTANDLAIFIESDLTLSNASKREFTGATYTRAYPIDIKASWRSAETATVRINGLKKTDRLMIGAYKKVSESNRFFLYQVKVEKVSESSTELFDITDDVSLRTFYARVSGGETGLNANVRNDVTASSTTASAWVPLNGYTGTLEGNDKTITGLTKPFFADLCGTVQNLTLNSTINYTTDIPDERVDSEGDSWEGLGVFAQHLHGTMNNCNSQGSVTYCPEDAIPNSTRCIAGLVGKVLTGGSLTGCSNEASISVPHNNQSNAVHIDIGGAVGRMGSTTASSNVSNSGSISVSIVNATTGNSYQGHIGGVVGYITSSASAISGFENSGPVSFTGTIHSKLYIGGIAGYAGKNVSGCTNSGTITAAGVMNSSSSSDYRAVGGIVGYAAANLSNNTNTSTATIINSGSSTGWTAVAGIVGYTQGTVSGGGNAAQVKHLGSSSNSVMLAGVVGRSNTGSNSTTRVNNVSNSGAIILTEGASHAGQTIYLSGITGHQQGGKILASNTGPLSVTSLHCNALVVGGICARTRDESGAGVILSGSSNSASGDISISGTTASTGMYVGGVVGETWNDVTATNAGDVQVNSTTSLTGGVLYVGGLVGRHNSGTLSGSHNDGSVSNAASTADDDIDVGGLVGKSLAGISSSYNNGTVTNSAASGVDVCLGGVAGNWQGGTMSSSYNTKNVVNTSGGTGKYIYVGGVSGYSKNSSWSSCSNRAGAVSNAAAADTLICVAGIAAYSLNESEEPVFTTCYNTGAVSNTGKGNGIPSRISDNIDLEACVGGLAGFLEGEHNLSGSSSNYNYNNGSVTENSATSHVAVGGVVAMAGNVSTTLEYARNNANGDIAHKDNDNDMTYIGGILGVGYTYCIIDNTTNAGDIVFTGVTTDQLWCGGIVGQWHENADKVTPTTATISGCTNTGVIKTNGTGYTDLVAGGTANSYVGGIVGGALSDHKNKTYTKCKNKGNITLYTSLKCRLGGIAGTCQLPPNRCEVWANITYKRTKYPSDNTGNANVGGIVGFKQGSGSTSFSYLLYSGNIDAGSNSPDSYVGGILGYTTHNTTFTFTSCDINGVFTSASADHSSNLFAARFFSGGNAKNTRKFTFPSCQIKTGSQLVASPSYSVPAVGQTVDDLYYCAPHTCVKASGASMPTVVSAIASENAMINHE